MKKFSIIFFIIMALNILNSDIVKATEEEKIGTIEFTAVCEQSVYDNEYVIDITVTDSSNEYFVQLDSIYNYANTLSLPYGKYKVSKIVIKDSSENIIEYKTEYEKNITVKSSSVSQVIYVGNVTKEEKEEQENTVDNFNLSTGTVQFKANVGEKIDKESTICVSIRNTDTNAVNTYFLDRVNEYESTEAVQYGNYIISEVYIADKKGKTTKEYYECSKTNLVISDSPESIEINIGFDEISNNNENQINTEKEWEIAENNDSKTISMINSTYNYQTKEKEKNKKLSKFFERNAFNLILFIVILTGFTITYISKEKKKDAF